MVLTPPGHVGGPASVTGRSLLAPHRPPSPHSSPFLLAGLETHLGWQPPQGAVRFPPRGRKPAHTSTRLRPPGEQQRCPPAEALALTQSHCPEGRCTESLPQAVTRGDSHTGPTRSPARTGPEVSGVAGWPPNPFALGHEAQPRRGNRLRGKEPVVPTARADATGPAGAPASSGACPSCSH